MSDLTIANERAALEELVRRCRGNMSRIARALSDAGDPITRQAITRRLEKYGLTKLVSQLAVEAGVSGRRRRGDPADAKAHRAERERILNGLAAAPTYDAAAEPLGIPTRTLYHRIARYKITPDDVAARRKRLARKRPAAARAQ